METKQNLSESKIQKCDTSNADKRKVTRIGCTCNSINQSINRKVMRIAVELFKSQITIPLNKYLKRTHNQELTSIFLCEFDENTKEEDNIFSMNALEKRRTGMLLFC